MAVAGQLVALDEGGEVGADDLDLDAGFLHVGHLTGDDVALLHLAGVAIGSPSSCLMPARCAPLLDIDVEHLRP